MTESHAANSATSGERTFMDLYPGVRLWKDMMNGPWQANATSATVEQPMLEPLTDQHQVLDETKHLVDTWFERRHETLQAAGALAEELRKTKSGPEMIAPLMDWYMSSMSRLAKDVSDQVAYTGKVMASCTPSMLSPALAGLPRTGERASPNSPANGGAHH